MSESFFDYDQMVRDALKNVVRNVLTEVAKNGLVGEHHFYVAFQTGYPGVQIPDHLREKYPGDMTIVIQHRYWGLRVHQDRFEIGLSFNQKPEHLIIPFEAITGFVDPSAQFALQFEMDGDIDEGDEIVAEIDTGLQDEQHLSFEPMDDGGTENNAAEASSDSSPASDNVVTLDAFRKK